MENAKLWALRTLQSHQAGNTNKYRTARKHNSKQKLLLTQWSGMYMQTNVMEDIPLLAGFIRHCGSEKKIQNLPKNLLGCLLNYIPIQETFIPKVCGGAQESLCLPCTQGDSDKKPHSMKHYKGDK